MQDDVSIRNYYDETGNEQYSQALLPKHLVSELLQSLHGTAKKHPGISKMPHEILQNTTLQELQRSSENGSKDVKYA